MTRIALAIGFLALFTVSCGLEQSTADLTGSDGGSGSDDGASGGGNDGGTSPDVDSGIDSTNGIVITVRSGFTIEGLCGPRSPTTGWPVGAWDTSIKTTIKCAGPHVLAFNVRDTSNNFYVLGATSQLPDGRWCNDRFEASFKDDVFVGTVPNPPSNGFAYECSPIDRQQTPASQLGWNYVWRSVDSN